MDRQNASGAAFQALHQGPPFLIRSVSARPPRQQCSLPKGMVQQWSMFSRRFEKPLWKATSLAGEHSLVPFGETFGFLQAPMLAMGVSDDEWGTPAAINRLLGHCEYCRKYHLRIRPAAINELARNHSKQ